MIGYLRQSTAATVKIGPFVDTTGSSLTSLTIAQADVRVSKNGGNMASKNNATSCTHDELGIYDCPLSTTDTDTLGVLDVMIKPTNALHVRHSFQVVTAEWWDKMCAAGTFTVAITSNIKKNQALAGFTFMMTDSTNHAPITGRTVTLTRSIDGAAFGAATNAVTERSNGIYVISLSAADLNGNSITFRATATGSDDTFWTIVTQP